MRARRTEVGHRSKLKNGQSLGPFVVSCPRTSKHCMTVEGELMRNVEH